jgi:hypothetical protein
VEYLRAQLVLVTGCVPKQTPSNAYPALRSLRACRWAILAHQLSVLLPEPRQTPARPSPLPTATLRARRATRRRLPDARAPMLFDVPAARYSCEVRLRGEAAMTCHEAKRMRPGGTAADHERGAPSPETMPSPPIGSGPRVGVMCSDCLTGVNDHRKSPVARTFLSRRESPRRRPSYLDCM